MNKHETIWRGLILVPLFVGIIFISGFVSHSVLNPQEPPQIIEVSCPTINQTRIMEELLQRFEKQAMENAQRDIYQDPEWLWREPEIITVTNNETIIKEVEVIKTRVVNNEWREFESLAEFTAWVEDKIVTLLPNGGDPKTADCDDYAERIQLLAYKDGFLLSAQLVDKDGKVFGVTVSEGEGPHDGIRVNIGNDIYFFEPQPAKVKIILVGHRD